MLEYVYERTKGARSMVAHTQVEDDFGYQCCRYLGLPLDVMIDRFTAIAESLVLRTENVDDNAKWTEDFDQAASNMEGTPSGPPRWTLRVAKAVAEAVIEHRAAPCPEMQG